MITFPAQNSPLLILETPWINEVAVGSVPPITSNVTLPVHSSKQSRWSGIAFSITKTSGCSIVNSNSIGQLSPSSITTA